ncbi:hypothetical protein QQG55_13755 [Brugia pahangi]
MIANVSPLSFISFQKFAFHLIQYTSCLGKRRKNLKFQSQEKVDFYSDHKTFVFSSKPYTEAVINSQIIWSFIDAFHEYRIGM